MAATSAINGSRIASIAPALKNISTSRVTQLFQKVDWALVFYVTVAVGYLFYHLYKWAQFNSHSSLGLDESLRLVRCKALLAEAREKALTSNVEPLLQECETLLASVSDRSHSFETKPVVLELALYYVNKNPDRACQIAQQLSSSYRLNEVAQAIQKQHPDFDKGKLNSLWEKAFEAVERNQNSSSLKMPYVYLQQWLEFVKSFYAYGNTVYKNRALAQALDLAAHSENDLDRISAWRQIAKCYRQIGGIRHIDSSIPIAQKLITEKKLEDSIPAQLDLALMLFYAGRNEEARLVANRAMDLFSGSDAKVMAEQLFLFVMLEKKIKELGIELPGFNFNAKVFIDTALKAVLESELNAETLVNLYLKIIRAYQQTDDIKKVEEVVGYALPMIRDVEDSHQRARYFLDLAHYQPERMKKEVADLALEPIRALPESTDAEIHSKRDLLGELLQSCSPEESKASLQILESLYEKVTEPGRKVEMGMMILRLYNQKNMTTETSTFFEKFLDDFKKNDEGLRSRISRLGIELINPYNPEEYFKNETTLKQIQQLLEEAERLLPQLGSFSRNIDLAYLAQGWLRIDRQKALKLLEGIEKKQAIRHIASASVAAVALGAMYYYRDSFFVPPLLLALTII